MAEPLAPLLKAIEEVLAVLGDPKKLDNRLRHEVEDLRRMYDKYVDCCCHAGTVNPKPGPKPPSKQA